MPQLSVEKRSHGRGYEGWRHGGELNRPVGLSAGWSDATGTERGEIQMLTPGTPGTGSPHGEEEPP